MRVLFLACLALGLGLGVVSMIAGIDRDRRHGRWVKYLNLPTAGAAIALFGVVGYPLARYTTLRPGWMLLIAGGSALAGALGVVALIAGWAVPSADREVKDPRYALQGQLGRVTQSIGATAAGEIAYELGGAPHTLRAQSLDGGAIARGADIVIERVEEGIAYVERWSTIARQLELPS